MPGANHNGSVFVKEYAPEGGNLCSLTTALAFGCLDNIVILLKFSKLSVLGFYTVFR